MNETVTRTEKDLLGELEIPSAAYWGIHTARAAANFPFATGGVPRGLIRAYALVKKACCLANRELGYLDARKADAIARACGEINGGGLSEEFPLDALQGGAGTSTNMNVNEVLANRALELLGCDKGDYREIDPIAHVNLHQSTNDTYPTALKIAAIFALRELSGTLAALQEVFQGLEKKFAGFPKIGRTELQDAVPVTLGAEFSAFSEAIARDRWRTFKAEERLRVVNLGGTAVGTGMTAPRSYIFLAIEKLREVTGLGLSRGENLLDQTANADCFAEVSGSLNACAANMIKIATDMRLLHYLGEIGLPPVQAGSSIMPGKVNPVIAEAVISAGLKVQANDALVSRAVSMGTLQINEYLPLISAAFLESIELLCVCANILAKSAEKISANSVICVERMNNSPALITAFLPLIGYSAAEKVATEFKESGETNLRRFLEERLGREMVDQALAPENLLSLGHKQ